MKFIDMFCGIGTIRMGMEQAGHECVYSIEWDKWKRRIYGIIFGEEPEGQDIRECRADNLPKADCWCFGAPCQDFSVAGKREGLEGDRSSLVREVFRLVRETKEEYRPEWLFYENVKGMFSSNKGLDYFQILCEMDELGYDIEWQLLNSKDFGVPQNRERVFTIGHLRGRSARKIFPITESEGIYNKTREDKEELHKNSRDTALCLTKCGQQNWTGSFINVVANLNQPGRHESAGRIYGTDGIAPCLNTCGGGGLETKIIVKACLTPNRLEKRQNGRRFKEDGESMFTLTKQDIHGVMIQAVGDNPYVAKKYEEFIDKNGYMPEIFNPYNCSEITDIAPTLTAQGATVTKSSTVLKHQEGRIRRLTPKECWRLQGIKDEITNKVIAAGISDTQMYKGAGDATTVNVIYEIAKRMS